MSGPLGSAQWMYASGVEEGQSLRFNDNDSQYLNRTPSSAGNRRTWTWSGWVKRGNIGLYYPHLMRSNATMVRFKDSDALQFYGVSADISTSAVFRDTSAWYHIVFSMDTTQATSTDRLKIYVNGIEQTVSGTYPPLNTQYDFNNNSYVHYIGQSGSSTSFFDGYMSDIHFIDGQALDATSFGETIDGYWKAKDYSGSYGTNGFRLEFDGDTTDSSGNGNDWTANNISAHDYVPHSPTNNFAVLNSTSYGKNGSGSAPVFTEGNLRIYESSSSWSSSLSTIAVSSGKWYAEAVIVTGTNSLVGVMEVDETSLFYYTNSMYMGRLANSYGYIHSGTVYNNNISSAYGATYTTGDVIGIALDMDAGTLTFYKNGVSQGTAATGLAGSVAFGFSSNLSTLAANFGQDSTFAGNTTAGGNTDANGIGDFKYPVPAGGYLSLCTSNLPTPTIVDGSEHFNTVLYTGNGSTNAITGVGFDLSADGGLVWIKNRTSGYSHGLYDTVRGTGTTKSLSSNITGQEGFYSSYHNLVSFDSDGFTLGSTSLTNGLNASGQSHVAWNWKAGGTAVSNTDGSITSQVSANVDAGFSITSYVGTGSADTVGHGLSSTPTLIITKQRSSSNPWPVNSGTLFTSGNMMFLDRTDGQVVGGSNALASYSNTTFGVAAQGATGAINDSGETYIAYCFANSDVCKVGSYTGNGSSTNGPFVYTGFRPAWVMFKCTSLSGSQWVIYDAVRDSFNAVDSWLNPNRENAEGTDSIYDVDFTANGFKIRNSDIAWNTSGASYIYLAFASSPFKYANAR